MAYTYTLIEAKTLATTTASVTFSSVPQTYTDLILQVSARSSETDNASSLRVTFNGSTASITVLELRAIGTAVASYSISYAQAGYVAGGQSAANTFGSASIYVPNYTGNKNKSNAGDIVQASNTSGENYIVSDARRWGVTDAITSVTVAPGLGSWLQYSNFYLYGISNS
jgi:hypothetical protein